MWFSGIMLCCVVCLIFKCIVISLSSLQLCWCDFFSSTVSISPFSLHHSLPFLHTGLLYHCIPSSQWTNNHWFHRLTPLSLHSACHSPPLTHTMRETHWPSMLEGADLPSINKHPHMYTLILFYTCTPGGKQRYVTLESGEWTEKGWSEMQNRCPRCPCYAGKPSWIEWASHCETLHLWCSSPQALTGVSGRQKIGQKKGVEGGWVFWRATQDCHIHIPKGKRWWGGDGE